MMKREFDCDPAWNWRIKKNRISQRMRYLISAADGVAPGPPSALMTLRGYLVVLSLQSLLGETSHISSILRFLCVWVLCRNFSERKHSRLICSKTYDISRLASLKSVDCYGRQLSRRTRNLLLVEFFPLASEIFSPSKPVDKNSWWVDFKCVAVCCPSC